MDKDLNYKQVLQETRFIDEHMHLGLHSKVHYQNYSDQNVIDIEKQFNVEKCLCSHVMGFTDVEEQIPQIERLSEVLGDHVYWYLVYNPNNTDKSLNVVKKNVDRINFAGIKIHPVRHSCRLDDEKYRPLWQFAVENDIVILAHTWSPYTENPAQFYGNPLLMDGVLEEFGELKFIAGHGGGKIHFYDKVIDLLCKHPNLYVDYSGDTLYPQIFKKVIARAGSKRILFGTDMPLIDIRYHIISLLKAGLTKEERDDIAYNNAAKLFKF